MKSVIGQSVRNAAALVVLSARGVEASVDRCNYDVLLQTRTQTASFRNSVVFPGGVCEPADSCPEWLRLFHSHGFTTTDFESFHRPESPITPILQDNPVLRHISLRITAIRETFEELGLLVCSRSPKNERTGVWASTIEDFDVKHWQNRVGNNPSELLTLCEELNCYPDIWSLYGWSNWLSPYHLKKRFDTAFFLAVLQNRPAVHPSEEVVKAEWLPPSSALARGSGLVLYPPQGYELARLCVPGDAAAAARVAGTLGPLYYHAAVRAKDGKVFVFPGDDFYPSSIDLNSHTEIESNKTVLELREASRVANRIEFTNSKTQNVVLKNYKSQLIDMENMVVPVIMTLS